MKKIIKKQDIINKGIKVREHHDDNLEDIGGYEEKGGVYLIHGEEVIAEGEHVYYHPSGYITVCKGGDDYYLMKDGKVIARGRDMFLYQNYDYSYKCDKGLYHLYNRDYKHMVSAKEIEELDYDYYGVKFPIANDLENQDIGIKVLTPYEFNELIYEYSIQTDIKFKSEYHKEELLKEFNEIILNHDDPQDIYLFANKGAANRFLFGHELIDGNKRVHMIFTKEILKRIKPKDIQ